MNNQAKSNNVVDELLYEFVMNEMRQASELIKDLWTKVLAHAEDNSSKAKSLYIQAIKEQKAVAEEKAYMAIPLHISLSAIILVLGLYANQSDKNTLMTKQNTTLVQVTSAVIPTPEANTTAPKQINFPLQLVVAPPPAPVLTENNLMWQDDVSAKSTKKIKGQ
jgi:hypothetical protein